MRYYALQPAAFVFTESAVELAFKFVVEVIVKADHDTRSANSEQWCVRAFLRWGYLRVLPLPREADEGLVFLKSLCDSSSSALPFTVLCSTLHLHHRKGDEVITWSRSAGHFYITAQKEPGT